MPSTEPIQSGPYPVPADAPDGPTQMLAIVNWAASRTVMRFASTVARDAALPTPVDGMLCYVAADKSYYACVDGAWTLVLGDTGDVVVDLAAGLSGAIRARRSAQVVEVRFNVTGTIPVGNSGISINGGIPEDLCPLENRRGSAFVGGLSTAGAYVTSTGLVGVRNDTGATRTAADGAVIYLLPPQV